VRDRVGARRISRLEHKSFALQFLSEDVLSLLSLCLVLAQLDRLPPVDVLSSAMANALKTSSLATVLSQRGASDAT
jgi:hypothetical protein